MRTLTQLKKFFKSLGIDPPKHIDNCLEIYYGVPIPKEDPPVEPKPRYTDEWYSWSYKKDYKDFMEFSTQQSVFCCGVHEAGAFSVTEKYPEIWQAFFEYYLVNSKVLYLRTETLEQDAYAGINEALPKVGFREVTRIPSKHGKGAYNIIVWEWLKPDAKKKT